MPDQQFQTVLGFDFGTRRIGVAVGQMITKTASPLITLKWINQQPDWQTLDKLMKQWRPQACLVGQPLKMDGSPQAVTALAAQFQQQLAERYHLPILAVDERLSTKSARSDLFDLGGYKALKKENIDCIAACLIIETWLKQQI